MKINKTVQILSAISLMASSSAYAGFGLLQNGDFSCAPEVVQSNVQAVDTAIRAALKSEGFADAETFKKEANLVLEKPEVTERADSYLSWVGVDSENITDAAIFFGARYSSLEIQSNQNEQYVSHAQKILKLNRTQALALVSDIQSSMMNSRQ